MEGSRPRPKKTTITRSRAGCANCRKQKRKCDESRPCCGRCLRQGVPCSSNGTAVRFLDLTRPTQLRYSNTRLQTHSSSTDLQSPLRAESESSQRIHSGAEGEGAFAELSVVVTSPPGLPANRSSMGCRNESTIQDLGGTPATVPGNGRNHARLSTAVMHRAHVPRGTYQRSPPLAVGLIHSPQQPLAAQYGLSLVDRGYLAHFTTHVVETLPHALREVIPDLLGTVAVRHAILAVSASNLCFLRGERTVGTGEAIRAGSRPSSQDLTKSAHHMAHAISAIRLGEVNDAPAALFATIIFLAYYELESGTVQGVVTHVKALNSLLLQHEGTMFSMLAGTRYGLRLLRTWAILRTRVMIWFSVGSSLDVESPEETLLTSFCRRCGGVEEKVQLLLAQALAVDIRLLLATSLRVGYENMRESLVKMSTWYTVMRDGVDPGGDIPDRPLSQDECLERLSDLKREANALTRDSSLLPQHPPGAKTRSQIPPQSRELRALGIWPLQFEHHAQAMTQASLALAHLACDQATLTSVLTGGRSAFTSLTNTWVTRVLAIAEGLDPAACIFKNTYNAGITSILYFTSILYPNVSVIRYFREDLLPRLQRYGQCREDACGSLEIARVMLDRLWYETFERKGTVLFLAPILDQSAEKERYYDSTQDIWILVHRRDENGGLINECVRSS